MDVHGANEAPSSAEPRNAPGSRRYGDWLVRRHIASGGFGDVYEVEHTQTRRLGALKLLRSEFSSDRDAVLRFEREASLLRSLSLPGVATLYDVGEVAGEEPFLVMELLEGESLSARLRRHGRMAPERAVDVVEAVAAVLDAAHAAGVVHRDVKASNVFLAKDPTGRERIVLLDFGLGKLLGDGGPDLTRSRQIVGTPASMAPEQVLGGPIDARTDVYALGALAFALLTGRPPFEHESSLVLCQLHLHARVPSVSAVAPVPSSLDSVVARAMSKTADHRHPGCRSFAAALREAVEGEAKVRQTCVGVVSVRVSADPAALSEGELALFDDFERVPVQVPQQGLEEIADRVQTQIGRQERHAKSTARVGAIEKSTRQRNSS